MRYELKCTDKMGSFTYYYFSSRLPIRKPKDALKRGYMSDEMRLTLIEKEEEPTEIKIIHSIFEYWYKKYLKKC